MSQRDTRCSCLLTDNTAANWLPKPQLIVERLLYFTGRMAKLLIDGNNVAIAY